MVINYVLMYALCNLRGKCRVSAVACIVTPELRRYQVGNIITSESVRLMSIFMLSVMSRRFFIGDN